MRQHHTKSKGDLGVLKVQLELHLQGFSVFTSQSEHESFDLIAYKDKKFYRVQVKYRCAEAGKISISLHTTWTDKTRLHRTPYNFDELDVFAVYCPDTDVVYFVAADELAALNATFTLRTEPPKNNQTKGVRMASDYLLMPHHE